MRAMLLWMLFGAIAFCQEATSGFDVRATISGLAAYSQDLSDAPRDGNPGTGGIRAVLYPEWKIDENWSASASVDLHSRPYFYQDFNSQGYGIRADIIAAHLTYARIREGRSLVVRAGVLPAAFGSFGLRYDDAVNPLIDVPVMYGYYGQGISLQGFAGAEVDGTIGRLDGRVQFLNSSPANRRSIFDRDQYGAWVAGGGYTIRQGLRVGVSGFRGPYLDRNWPYYFPGEIAPKQLPGTGYGLDVQWGRGAWNAYGEWQRTVLTYTAIPAFREEAGYGELRRVLSPRWYVASRVGYVRSNATLPLQVVEAAIGLRTRVSQLIKLGYEVRHNPAAPRLWDSQVAIQFVSTFRPISIARD